MRLLIVRHAIAQPPGKDVADDDRQLTPRGRKRFRKAAKGLARIVPRPDALFTSPLARAVETAKIAADAWGRIEPTLEPRLASGDDEALLSSVVAAHGEDAVVALVGHEPHVSALLARLVNGAGQHLPFKKGGAALVEVDEDARSGRLMWFAPPRLLRRLGSD
jgi:phosphohistidine phosphatase